MSNNHFTGNSVCVWRTNRLRAPDSETFRIETSVSVGPGLKPSDATFNRRSRQRPIDHTVFLFQHRSEGRVLIVLRAWCEVTQTRQSFTQQYRADLCEPLHQLRRRLSRTDLCFRLHEDW